MMAYIQLSKEKIEAIRADFGTGKGCVIMAHYRAEQESLPKEFPDALVVSSTSNAEGVDYSMYNHLIIYSQGFSSAQHSQRRARQANMKRQTEIKVHFYLVKGGISEQVYKTVSVNKQNFIDSMFDRKGL